MAGYTVDGDVAFGRAPLEVASGPTPRSLAPLAAGDPLLAGEPEERLRARIASFAPPAVYVPSGSPPVVGALVKLRLRDRSRAAGEVLYSRPAFPLPGVAVRYVAEHDLPQRTQRAQSSEPSFSSVPSVAESLSGGARAAEDAWEALISADVPELPPAASAVLRVTASSRAGAADLARAVAPDAELSAAVLALANSADYRAAERLTDVRAAVVRLGLERVRSLVLASSVFRLFPPVESAREGETRISPAGIWTHALAAAFSAEAVARLCGIPPEDAFLTGLLHDLGKLLLARSLASRYSAVLDLVEERETTLADAEAETLGFTHARAGAWLLSKWRLPGSVVKAVAEHDLPQRAQRKERTAGPVSSVNSVAREAAGSLSAVACAGNLVARALAAGTTGDTRMPDPSREAWVALGIAADDVPLVVRRAAGAVAAGAGAFEEAGIRPPFLPRSPGATEADPILRAAARSAAERRVEELFKKPQKNLSEEPPSGAAADDPYFTALHEGALSLS